MDACIGLIAYFEINIKNRWKCVFFSLGEISSDGSFVTGKFIQWIQKRGQEQIFFRKKFQKKMCDSNQIFLIFNSQCELYYEVCCGFQTMSSHHS